MTNQSKSKCCGATAVLSHEQIGDNYYWCSECKERCDIQAEPTAYRVGIYMEDDDFLGDVDKGDLFIFMEDTPQNREIQSQLLLSGFANKKKPEKLADTAKGIDWSKKDMYEGIGRPDLKPKEPAHDGIEGILSEALKEEFSTSCHCSGKECVVVNTRSCQLDDIIFRALTSYRHSLISELVENFEKECGYLFNLDKTTKIHTTPSLNQASKNVVIEFLKSYL